MLEGANEVFLAVNASTYADFVNRSSKFVEIKNNGPSPYSPRGGVYLDSMGAVKLVTLLYDAPEVFFRFSSQ